MEVEKKEQQGNVIQETKEFLETFQKKENEEQQLKEDNIINFTHKHHDKYGFLSNLYGCKIMIDNLQFNSVEHYYQAMKFEGTKKFEVIRRAGKAIDAHKLAQKKDVQKSRDWKDLKLAKFDQNDNLKKQLLETNPKELVDVTPGDKFWGIGDKEDGKNMNGQILMSIRGQYLDSQKEEMKQ